MEETKPWLELQVLRERDGWTPEGLAKAADLSREHVRLLELGQRNPTPRTIRKLADALKVPYSVLQPSPRDNDTERKDRTERAAAAVQVAS